MSALALLHGSPNLGQIFSDFQQLKEWIEDWSIKEKFSFKIGDRDRSRAIFTCISTGCTWRVRANRTEEEDVQITVLSGEHSCIPDECGKRYSVASTHTWLRRHIPNHLSLTAATKPREIIECMRIQYGEMIPYKAALRLKTGILEETIDSQRDGFRLLPKYIDAVYKDNPNTFIRLSVDPRTNLFQRIFICPAESQESFALCRHFIAVDGTFLKTRFVQTLLLAVTIDANGHTLLLAWAIVESENSSSWEYFLRNLQLAIPILTTETTTLISDRDKGLQSACGILSPSVIRAYCCQHLKENFVTLHGRALSALFWKIARATTVEEFEHAMLQLRETKPAGEAYLRKIDPALWAQAHFTGKRYGHDTSNIVESVNNTLKLDRELSVIELLNSIWHRVMGQRFERLEIARSAPPSQQFTKFCTNLLGESRIWARQNTAQMATLTNGHVTQPDGTVRIVDLESKTCTCGKFQENGVPCGHAMSCILQIRQVLLSPLDILPSESDATGHWGVDGNSLT